MSGAAPDPGLGPLAGLLGMRRGVMAGGRCVFELDAGPTHLNPHGVVHGGVLYTLADYAMGCALTSRLGAGEQCTTIEIKINYVAPATGGRLRADAQVVERTRRIGTLEARVTAEDGALLALALGTFYIQG
ncbi:MAG: PaaI family thioesterase [Candidatus Rokubacteria bacterium]|nr:PaaI family thioesterase [Candidatus Rokubacteria bacterium]MBI2491156.1 PaaI family thioesterase [Candidatus Rokubacteria bacterium]